jgi:uncharacterized protein (DUF58 family)
VIPGGAVVEEPLDVFFARRGSYRENSFQFVTRFPFGFTERRIQVPVRGEVLVYPALDPHPGFEELLASLSGEIENHFRGRGHDFYRIRPYEMFESARHVDWKATAHTGDLQVREFAAEKEHTLEILLDLDAGKAGGDWFDNAVDCAAFLSFRVAMRGARLHFRTQDFELTVPEQGDIYIVLKYLALVAPASGKPLGPPWEESSFKVAITPNPGRVCDAGWETARIVSLDAFEKAPR